MLKLHKFIFLLIILIMVLGCQKEDPSAKSFSKISRIVKKNANFKDYISATSQKFIYDKSLTLTEFQLLQNNYQLLNTKFVYLLNNIVKKEIVNFGHTNPIKSSEELVFDSKKRLIKSTSALSFNTNRVQTFEYDTNSKYPKNTTLIDNGKLFEYKELSWKNGNLIEEKVYYNSKTDLQEIFKYEYDTHINLFISELNILYSNSTYSESIYFSENNLTKRTNTYSKDIYFDSPIVNKYFYNNEGNVYRMILGNLTDNFLEYFEIEYLSK